MCFSTTWTEASIDMAPYFLEEACDAAEAAEIGEFAEGRKTLLEEASEWRVGCAD